MLLRRFVMITMALLPVLMAPVLQQAPTPTALPSGPIPPTSTSALLQITPSAMPSPLPTTAGLEKGIPPPLDITLPAGWKAEYYLLPIREPLSAVTINLARYYGPVKNNGMGTILVLWNFPSMGAPPTAAPAGSTATPGPNVTPIDYPTQLLWSDGLRLLQGTVVGITCNVGRYEQRTFPIGDQTGIGAYYNVSNCANEPPTVGWFAGVRQNGQGYLFYMYVDPIEAYNEGRNDVQKVLDTVRFRVPTATQAATP